MTSFYFQGFYELKNIVLTDSYFMVHVLSGDVKFMIIAKMMGKIAKSKAMVHLFTLKAFGEIQK